MPEPEAANREAFLQRVADDLPFERAEKLDILRELATHLADSRKRLEAEGMTPEAAEREAVERLGPPERLAAELTDARRSPGRLLAAAGAGTWAAAGGVVYGYLFGLLAVLVASCAIVLLTASPFHLFSGTWANVLDPTAMTLLALAAGLYAAGFRLTQVVAARAGYGIRVARRVTATIGGALVLGYALVGWSGTLSWSTLPILLSLPAWFVAGAWRSSEARFPSRRWRLRVVGVAIIGVPLCLLIGQGGPDHWAGGGSWAPVGIERVGLPTPATVAAAQDYGSGSSTLASGTVSIATTIGDPAVLAGWRDLRVEAWRGISTAGIDPGLSPALDPAARAPFAVGPASFESPGSGWFGSWNAGTAIPDRAVTLGGSVRIDRDPSVTVAWLALTGIAPDGHRYLITGPSFTSTAFSGTALDWLIGVIQGR